MNQRGASRSIARFGMNQVAPLGQLPDGARAVAIMREGEGEGDRAVLEEQITIRQ